MKASVFSVGRSLPDASSPFFVTRLSIRPARQAHSSRGADRQSCSVDDCATSGCDRVQYTETLQVANLRDWPGKVTTFAVRVQRGTQSPWNQKEISI
jgi:hypothetical protein